MENFSKSKWVTVKKRLGTTDLSFHYPIFCTVFDPSFENCEKFGQKQIVCDLANFVYLNSIQTLLQKKLIFPIQWTFSSFYPNH